MWENEIQVYELQKGDSGLGFSILDYQVCVDVCVFIYQYYHNKRAVVEYELHITWFGESQLVWTTSTTWQQCFLIYYYSSLSLLRCHFLKLSQDPMNPGHTVIVIRSLVAGGLAERDGRLLPGDRLMFVNGTDLSHASLAQAVHVLKSTALGTVRIGVTKPLPVSISIHFTISTIHKPDSNNHNLEQCRRNLESKILYVCKGSVHRSIIK